MATDNPYDQEDAEFGQAIGNVDAALKQARSELAAMTDAASAADTMADDSGEGYSLHEVLGIGRYAVIRKTGWRPLIKVIHTPSANIDFSANMYPGFDGIIGQNFQSPYLLDPLNERYESYTNLRDNIAAVRNFLMESYYVNTPPGMTPEKAKQAMAEIAEYLGKGLDNNYKFLGVIPNHHLDKPFISIDEASASGGAGAQYIYEKILEMHRQSNWTRPFAAVIALFGGQAPPNWMLPPAHMTEFTDLFSHDIAPAGTTHGPKPEDLKKGIKTVEELEAARQRAIDKHTLTNVAIDLNMMGDQFLHTASNLQNVDALSEPVKRDAIEIAKDILRKLRTSFGDINIKNGLNLPPADDASALGAIKGVMRVYERMLGWARGIDASIMQHPSVMAANQAVGQLGYLAKAEALRMAKLVGNGKLADEISGQLAKVPAAYSAASDTKFSGLLDKIESGMNVLMTRVQTINGPTAKIAHSAARETGQSINQAPTAGLGQQASSTGKSTNDAAQQNAQMLAAEQAQQLVQTARARAESARANQQQAPRVPMGRQVAPQAQQKAPTVSTTTTSITNLANPSPRSTNQQQTDATRQAQLRHEQEERELQIRQRLEAQRQVQLAQQKTAAKVAAQKIDPNMLKGFQNATSIKGMGPVASLKKPVPSPQPKAPTQNTTKQGGSPVKPEDQNPLVPTPPTRGGGRGF